MTAVTNAKKLLAKSKVLAHPAYYTARDLDAAAHGKHDDLIEKLLVRGLVGPPYDWTMMYEIANDAWKFLGERAGTVWTAYEKVQTDDILRLEWYGTIAKQGKAFARPWLEKGRARKLDPQQTSGTLSKKVYEAKLDALLGKRSKSAPEAIAPSNPKLGYRFEAYTSAVLKAAVAAMKKVTLPEPISRIHLARMDDDITVHFIAFEGTGDPVVVKLPRIATKIPRTGDSADPVMKAFIQRHDLTGDPSAPSWGDSYQAPNAILIEELLGVVEVIHRTVRRAKRIELCVGDGDNMWKRSDAFGRQAKEHLEQLEPAIREDLLRLCFETPAKRKSYGG
jgi:hypothetical protein